MAEQSKIVLAAAFLATMLVGPRAALADDPGLALRFDGTSDFVRLAATSSMMSSGWPSTKTVSVWVNPTGSAACSASDPLTCDVIFGDRPRGWGISRGTILGLDRIWVWNIDGTLDRIGIEYTVGEWIQVTLVHEAGILSAYKNGVLVGSVASGATVQTTGQVLYLGGIISSTSKNLTFQGEIDEVRLWNVARSAAEILQDMNVSLAGSELGLAAYYKMSNGSGTALTDDSGHGWTGTLNDGGSGVPADGPIQWVSSGAFGVIGVPNAPPIADAQDVTTAEDTATPITLTGSDPDGDAITFRVLTQPAGGSLAGTGADLVYTPLPNSHGVDSFTFVVNDGRVDSAPQTVTVAILAVNDPPTAVDDSVRTGVDTQVAISVLANDSDVDGDALTVTDVGVPLNGMVDNNGTALIYTPNPGYTGSDTFSYSVSDSFGGSSSAAVTVTMQAADDPGHALRFDGASDYVSLGETSLMMAPGWKTTKTVSLWLKPTGSAACLARYASSCDAIFGDRPRWWGISRGMFNGLDRIWVFNYDVAERVIPIQYSPDEWIHIAMVHAGGILSAYKNGVLVGSVPSGATQQPGVGSPVLHFGGIINNASRNWTFAGDIDELQIWNTARTAAEIAEDMSRPLQGTEPGLAAYYRMSDGAGTWLTDDSGHGWAGQLHDGGQGVPPDGPITWVPSGAFVVP